MTGRRLGQVAAAMVQATIARADLDFVRVDRGRVRPAISVLLDDDRFVTADAVCRVADRLGTGGFVLRTARVGMESIEPGPDRAVVESIGLDRGGDWWGSDVREDGGQTRFRVFHHGRFRVEVRLSVPGRANVLPALAAVAACVRAEVGVGAIQDGLDEFAGLARRFERVGSYRGVTLVDDDATEPDDLAETLGLIAATYGHRRTSVVFAPAIGPSRDRVEPFRSVDRLTILGAPVDSAAWAGMLEGVVADVGEAAGIEDVLADLDRTLEPGDVLLTLGAGEVGTIADAFLRRLPRNRQGG